MEDIYGTFLYDLNLFTGFVESVELVEVDVDKWRFLEVIGVAE